MSKQQYDPVTFYSRCVFENKLRYIFERTTQRLEAFDLLTFFLYVCSLH